MTKNEMMISRFRLLFLLSALLAATPVAATEHRATPDGLPLQQVIAQAAAGDRVVVAAGLYRGGVVIDRPLTLLGEPGAIVDAEGVGDVIRVAATDVTIRNLTLRNSGFNLTHMNAAVHGTRGAHRLTVEGTTMEESAFGLWL